MACCLLYLALIVAIVLLLLQRRETIKNYHYRHRHYIVIHRQPLCVVQRQNISLSPYALFQVTNRRNVLFCNVAQPVTRATVSAVVCPTWRDITQAVGFHNGAIRYSSTEMKCFKEYRSVLKIDTEIASVLYIRVHSSRDRHCCIRRYNYISGRDQVEVSKTRSKSTTANNLCFRYSGGRSSSNASPEKQYKTRVGEPKALRPPDLEVARTSAHPLDVSKYTYSISKS
jgi:hypothetical protein